MSAPYDKDVFTQAFLAEEVYGEYKDGKLTFKHRQIDENGTFHKACRLILQTA